MSSALSGAEFENLVRSIHEHGKLHIAEVAAGRTPPAKHVLPSHISTAKVPDLPAEVREAFDVFVTGTQELVAENMDLAAAAQQFLNGDKARSDFQDLIRKQADKFKRGFNDLFDVLRDKIIESGEAHPGQVDEIIAAFDGVSDFFTDRFDDVADFYSKLVKNVSEQANQVSSFFQNLQNQIQDWRANHPG
ncbi:hypothetical protein AB0L53_14440 [Nonomuraea sp. NPDC052129]|uniref:hypothetical protein n=1 Tax=Nonomuraea sp. NPDC052129 TaxID=3154651 RepID=UPI003427BCE0